MKKLLLLCSFFYVFDLVGLATLRPAPAATNDVAFNLCLKRLSQQRDVLNTNSWYDSSPPPAIERFERALSDDGHIQRWTFHKNINGTVTFIVLNRANGAAPQDDPDDFDVFIERKAIIVYVETFGVSAEAFLKTRAAGVNGIVSCTQDKIGGRLSWNGHDWD
jgi:hypothetical protein